MEPQLIHQDAAKKIPLFSKVTLQDLLDIETRSHPSYPFICTYISTLTPVHHSIPSVLQPDSVIFTCSFTAILISKVIIVLYTQESHLESTRLNLKTSQNPIQAY